jgi:hypothetical protein
MACGCTQSADALLRCILCKTGTSDEVKNERMILHFPVLAANPKLDPMTCLEQDDPPQTHRLPELLQGSCWMARHADLESRVRTESGAKVI